MFVNNIFLITIALFQVTYGRGCLSCEKCAVCSGSTNYGENQKLISVNLMGCKNASISWFCCRSSVGGLSSSCELFDCNGSKAPEKNKCDEVSTLQYLVPKGATQLKVQLHDGQFAGTKDCEKDGDCCGGSKGSCSTSISGVCETVIDLNSCQDADQDGCNSDSDCSDLDTECSYGYCDINRECKRKYHLGKVCRESSGDCDLPEMCLEGEAECPEDIYKDSSNICRESAGDCDEKETCTGVGPSCPEDARKPKLILCRSSKGDCDLEEYCDGESVNCPDDLFQDSNVVCRESEGDCDEQETCSGQSPSCPGDEKKPKNTLCRTSKGDCDLEEYCDGESDYCPDDLFKNSSIVCRKSEGDCDIQETCTGDSASCPENFIKPVNTLCRDSQGECDIEEYCDGKAVTCPKDSFKDSSVVCRESLGVCDKQEKCTGNSPLCPSDQKQPNTKSCRAPFMVAGTTCDQEEFCDGVSNHCPLDKWLPSGTVCRSKKDSCDIPETCSGSSPLCSDDLRNDHGYTFKCALTQYLCGVKREQLTVGAGKQYIFGTCVIGTASEFVNLPWPSCLSQCMNKICPNNRGISNYAEAHCNVNGTSFNWQCDSKVNVDSSTPLPHCPPWIPLD